jgi:hypothetical protein
MNQESKEAFVAGVTCAIKTLDFLKGVVDSQKFVNCGEALDDKTLAGIKLLIDTITLNVNRTRDGVLLAAESAPEIPIADIIESLKLELVG